MNKKIIFYVLISILLAAWQLSFVGSLPAWFGNINAILVILVFAVGLAKGSFAHILAISAGLFLDINSFVPFGLNLLGLIAVALAVDFVHTNFLTNQSLYTYIALVAAATAIFRIWSYLFYLIGSVFSDFRFQLVFNRAFWESQAAAILLNSILAAIVFYFLTQVSRSLTPVFLSARKK